MAFLEDLPRAPSLAVAPGGEWFLYTRDQSQSDIVFVDPTRSEYPSPCRRPFSASGERFLYTRDQSQSDIVFVALTRSEHPSLRAMSNPRDSADARTQQSLRAPPHGGAPARSSRLAGDWPDP